MKKKKKKKKKKKIRTIYMCRPEFENWGLKERPLSENGGLSERPLTEKRGGGGSVGVGGGAGWEL